MYKEVFIMSRNRLKSHYLKLLIGFKIKGHVERERLLLSQYAL